MLFQAVGLHAAQRPTKPVCCPLFRGVAEKTSPPGVRSRPAEVLMHGLDPDSPLAADFSVTHPLQPSENMADVHPEKPSKSAEKRKPASSLLCVIRHAGGFARLWSRFRAPGAVRCDTCFNALYVSGQQRRAAQTQRPGLLHWLHFGRNPPWGRTSTGVRVPGRRCC